MTKVVTITCPECKYTIFSRARQDFRLCFCGKVWIDGGLDYTRVGFNPEIDAPQPEVKEILQTPRELYDDWNFGNDIYGRISPVFEIEKEDKEDKK